MWRADRTAFARFDRWLFEPETPRTAAEAREYAASLAPHVDLAESENDEWITERIAADVEAFGESGLDTIPVLLSPEMDAVVGRPQSAAELFEILEDELGLKPVDGAAGVLE